MHKIIDATRKIPDSGLWSTLTCTSPVRASLMAAASSFFRCCWRTASPPFAIWVAIWNLWCRCAATSRTANALGRQIFFAGPYLDGSPPSFQPSLVVTQRRRKPAEDVHTLVQQGVDFIKVQSILSRDAYFAIAAAARREHITFVGHVPDRVTAAEASDAGQKSIEHLTGVLRACSSDEPRLMREQFQAGPKNATPENSHAREMAWERELLRDVFRQTSRRADRRVRSQPEPGKSPH